LKSHGSVVDRESRRVFVNPRARKLPGRIERQRSLERRLTRLATIAIPDINSSAEIGSGVAALGIAKLKKRDPSRCSRSPNPTRRGVSFTGKRRRISGCQARHVEAQIDAECPPKVKNPLEIVSGSALAVGTIAANATTQAAATLPDRTCRNIETSSPIDACLQRRIQWRGSGALHRMWLPRHRASRRAGDDALTGSGPAAVER
jgi:hypothetical protein